MISGEEVKVLDLNSEYFGVPTSELMENAGKGITDFILNKFKSKNILIFCGTGNNGGDGLVAARYLSKKCNVTVYLTAREIPSKIARNNFDKLTKTNVKIYIHKDLKTIDNLIEENDIIVDAILGIGLTGSLREPLLNEKRFSDQDQKIIQSATGVMREASSKAQMENAIEAVIDLLAGRVDTAERRLGIQPSNGVLNQKPLEVEITGGWVEGGDGYEYLDNGDGTFERRKK